MLKAAEIGCNRKGVLIVRIKKRGTIQKALLKCYNCKTDLFLLGGWF